MAAVRYLVATWLIVMFAACSGFGAEGRFELAAALEGHPWENSSSVLVIELKNASKDRQKIICDWAYLQNVPYFGGTVYLRDSKGEIYPFVESNHWVLRTTGVPITDNLELAPGASHVFRYPLSQFIDWRRMESSRVTGNRDSYAVLSEEFGPGSEIWCELKTREAKPFGKRGTIGRVTETVRSPSLMDVRPPLLFDPSAKAFLKNPFVRDYAPLLTREEQEQSKTGDELYADYEEGRAKERAKYPRPLRSLMEARDAPDDSQLIAYKRALNEVRKTPAPELFRQFAESIDEGTCQVRGMLENVLFDGYLKLEPWREENWRKAMRALVDALPCVGTSQGLQQMLIFIVQAKEIGRLQFDVPGTDAKVDVRAARTTHGSSETWPCVEKVSEDLLAQVSQECRRALRERYPELR